MRWQPELYFGLRRPNYNTPGAMNGARQWARVEYFGNQYDPELIRGVWGYASISPSLIAIRTAEMISWTPSLASIRLRWKAAVLEVVPNLRATSLVLKPSARSLKTSISRGVSDSLHVRGSLRTRASGEGHCNLGWIARSGVISTLCFT